jgi:hypothetical protein
MIAPSGVTRLVWVIVLVAAVALVAAAAGGAAGRPPDVADTAAGLVAVPAVTEVGSPPDVRDATEAYRAQAAVPDVFERYVAVHPYGVGLSGIEAGSAARPPDVADAALAVSATPAATGGSGFAWNEYLIGIGTGVVVLGLLAAFVIGGRHYWHDHHHPAPA